MQQVTDTTRIGLSARFRFDSADESIQAIQSARIKCLTAGQELIRAYYDLRGHRGGEPTTIDLINAAAKRYTPPRSKKGRDEFWRDYLLTNLWRGIFCVAL